MKRCSICGRSSILIAEIIGVCDDCLRRNPEGSSAFIQQAHLISRRESGLPEEPPRHEGGVPCTLCVNQCLIPSGGSGYCGLRKNRDGRLEGPTARCGNLSWYHDPLPTNCVAAWVCPAGTSSGYPRFSRVKGPEFGFKNLAVFYNGCSFDCLYCQNHQYRLRVKRPQWVGDEELAEKADRLTTCICYFGGDPSSQVDHAISVARKALQRSRGRPMRICWETNGSVNPAVLVEMIELSLQSGGCLKFDLKAWDPTIHKALTGRDNRCTLENFRKAAGRATERPDPPLVVASTLLVPGYVDEEEVSEIARFIASCDREIPYSLLGFHPHFYMNDLPTTSRSHARRCLEAARDAGLKRVRVGNQHLLSEDY